MKNNSKLAKQNFRAVDNCRNTDDMLHNPVTNWSPSFGRLSRMLASEINAVHRNFGRSAEQMTATDAIKATKSHVQKIYQQPV
ncbi:MAG: hypothetical protein ABJC87_24230 [Roseobacter sp.]